MSNATRSFGRIILSAFAALSSALLLAGCGASTEEQVAEQVAIAKEAADRAVEAQEAAERAAASARAQSNPGSFGEDEIIEEIDDTPGKDISDPGEDDPSATAEEADAAHSPAAPS